jgi:hypothetical protein
MITTHCIAVDKMATQLPVHSYIKLQKVGIHLSVEVFVIRKIFQTNVL